jgi:hypothetical protein
VLARRPALDALHPGLRTALEALLDNPDAHALYALPYSIAWPTSWPGPRRAARRRRGAVSERPDFAHTCDCVRATCRPTTTRARRRLGAGRFGALNAQIGSYETYDDKLYGAKTFFGMSVLLRDAGRSAKLAGATAGLQRLQDALPYDGKKRVSEDIPVGVYDVIADFGQARGTNTATILPNDPEHVRKYGRTILIRHNIIAEPTLFAYVRAAWEATVAPDQRNDLESEGYLLRILWHEIGHYLGPDHTASGATVSATLAEYSDLFEEMKADLVSLWSAPAQREAGAIDDATLRSYYASGIRRVLQRVKPLREQPYETMELMQMNYFIENGVLAWRDGVLHIDYDAYPAAVTKMLAEVLKIQAAGDHDAAAAFVDRYATWDEKLHGALAKRIETASSIRYRLVRYGALGE